MKFLYLDALEVSFDKIVAHLLIPYDLTEVAYIKCVNLVVFANLFIVYAQRNKFLITIFIMNQIMKFMLEFTTLNNFKF